MYGVYLKLYIALAIRFLHIASFVLLGLMLPVFYVL